MLSAPLDDREIGAQERRAKWKLERQQDDLRFVLSSVQGRRFIWFLLEQAAVFQHLPLRSNNEAQLTGADIQRQNAGKELLQAVLTVDASKFTVMQTEAAHLREIEEPTEGQDDETMGL